MYYDDLWLERIFQEVLPDNVVFFSHHVFERHKRYPNAPVVKFDYKTDDLRFHKAWLLKQSKLATMKLENDAVLEKFWEERGGKPKNS
jgi:hypothetical protein